ncbi:hypothetical protein K2P56_02270 [Patescibacteria group bacterium]|nr:hypothetical protein [Patescibacteria group bacterium]
MPRRQEQKPYTPEILARAEALHSSGLMWKTVAERIGHSFGSLMTTRSQIKKNTTRVTAGEMRAESARKMAYVETLISLGMKPKEMQHVLKLSGSALSMRFLSWGLDREERVALRLADEIFAGTLQKARAIVREYSGSSLPARKSAELRELKRELHRRSELRLAEIEALVHNSQDASISETHSEA